MTQKQVLVGYRLSQGKKGHQRARDPIVVSGRLFLGVSERIIGISIISYGKNSLDLRPTWVMTSPQERIEFVSQGPTVYFYVLSIYLVLHWFWFSIFDFLLWVRTSYNVKNRNHCVTLVPVLSDANVYGLICSIPTLYSGCPGFRYGPVHWLSWHVLFGLFVLLAVYFRLGHYRLFPHWFQFVSH